MKNWEFDYRRNRSIQKIRTVLLKLLFIQSVSDKKNTKRRKCFVSLRHSQILDLLILIRNIVSLIYQPISTDAFVVNVVQSSFRFDFVTSIDDFDWSLDVLSIIFIIVFIAFVIKYVRLEVLFVSWVRWLSFDLRFVSVQCAAFAIVQAVTLITGLFVGLLMIQSHLESSETVASTIRFCFLILFGMVVTIIWIFIIIFAVKFSKLLQIHS